MDHGFRGGLGNTITQITPRSWLFLALSGLATGGSWICYFKALSLGDVNKVVPVDKSSTVMAVLLAIVLFGETSHLEVKLVGTSGDCRGNFHDDREEAGHFGRAKSFLVSVCAVGSGARCPHLVLLKVGIEGR